MARSLGYYFILLLAACLSLRATDLPKDADPDSSDIEPPILFPNLDRDNPRTNPAKAADAAPADVDKLEKDLARAKRNSAGASRLCQIGVIAQIEVEQRALRVARLQAQLENARLTAAKENFSGEQERKNKGEITDDDLAGAAADLARLIETAQVAEQAHQCAELAFAENNVRRQQKLVALGSGRKSDIARAEQKLAELKAGKENN